MITTNSVHDYITSNFEHVFPKSSWGETSFFVNPGQQFKHGAYFATVKEKDGDNDKASALDRDGVWRLNMGITPKEFESRFGRRPARPAKGGIIQGDWDFKQTDQIMPHPIYGWMAWVCVLSPSQSTFESCKSLLDIAYKKSCATLEKRLKREAK